MSLRKILFFDCETTGTNSYKHGIWQYAGIMTIDGKEVDRIEIECLPLEGLEVDPDALKAVGKAPDFLEVEMLQKGELAWHEFRAFLEKYIAPRNKRDKAILAGYNVKFDEKFLRATWIKMKSNYFGSYFTKPSLDVWQMAMMYLGPEWLTMPNHKLATVAERILGRATTEGADWHDAMVDIEMTRLMYDKIYNQIWKRKDSQSVLQS